MKVNQLKAGVMLSYISMAVTNLISIVYTPIMLRILGQSEYGLFQLAHSVVSYLGLLSFGFGSAYVRFYSLYKKDNDEKGIAKLNGMFMVCYLCMSLLALIFGGILVANVENIFGAKLTLAELEKTKVLMGIMVFNVALMFPNSVLNSNVTAHEKYLFQRSVSFASSVLNPMLVLILLFLGFRSVGMVLSTTVVSVLKLTVDFYYCVKKLKIKFIFKDFNFSLLKEVWVFSLFIFINTITDMLNYSVDKFVLGMVQGTTAIAIYSVGASLNSYYTSFSSSISTVFIPRVNRMVASGCDDSEITELFTKVGRIQFIVLSLVMSGYIIFGRAFINIWAGPGYENAYYVGLMIMLPSTIPLIQNVGIEIQRAKNLHKFRSITYLFVALGNLFISIPLAKVWGELGSALGTGIAVVIGNCILMNIYYHKRIKLNMIYFWKNIIRMSIPVLCVMAVSFVIFTRVNITSYFELFLSILCYVTVFAVVLWKFGLNIYEKTLFSGFLKKLNIRRNNNVQK